MFMLLTAGSLNLVVDAQTNSSLLPITVLPGDGETCPSSETARSEIEEEVRTILQQIFNLTDSGSSGTPVSCKHQHNLFKHNIMFK